MPQGLEKMASTDQPAPAAAAPQPRVFAPHEMLAYIAAGVVLALAQGLGQGFVSSNIPQISGDLGISVTDGSWLMAAYMVPRASLPLLLIKIRTQFGLRRFAEVGVIVYALVVLASIWISDFRSAVVVQFLSGVSSAPLSTLGFLYILEPLPQQWKMRFGMPMALCVMMMGSSLARVVSPALIGDGGLTEMHLVSLGLALVSLALVFVLPLAHAPRQKVIRALDLLSFALIFCGFGGITVAFIMGPIHWWTAEPWIGALLAMSVVALSLTAIIEICRKAPLIDVRWLASPAILHLTATLLIFRLVLSEQSAGAPRMFQVLGVAPPQLTGLFIVISLASVVGALACVAWIKPGREAPFHLVALVLVAAGTLMDAQSTIDTRPEQFLISQALIGVAGMLFLPPAMLTGLMAALRKGPDYILSFIIVFLSTQSIGGVLGSGLFTTLINWRQSFHLQALTEQLQPTNPGVVAAITGRMAALQPQIADTAARQAQAVSLVVQDTANQALVMAYNDAYFLTFLVATAAACLLLLHLLRDWLVLRLSPPDPSPVPVPEGASPAGNQT